METVKAEPLQTGFIVYLCNGEVRVVPSAKGLEVCDERLVVFDERGIALAEFAATDIYLCATARTSPEPRI